MSTAVSPLAPLHVPEMPAIAGVRLATAAAGIRYAGRLAGDPPGQLSQGEQVLQAGSGVQTATNSRWGDYTSLTVDPSDGCTFWYISEYYARSGAPLPAPPDADTRPWQTRIGAFRFPGCS